MSRVALERTAESWDERSAPARGNNSPDQQVHSGHKPAYAVNQTENLYLHHTHNILITRLPGWGLYLYPYPYLD